MKELFEPVAVHGDTPGKMDEIMVWENGAASKISARWGLPPTQKEGVSYSLVTRETLIDREFFNPCLILVTKLWLSEGSGAGKSRRWLKLISDESFFCAAGLWRDEGYGWPRSFAGITVAAYPDVDDDELRHMALIRPGDWMDWLKGARPPDEFLGPLPLGSLQMSGPPPRRIAARRGPIRPAPPPPAPLDLFG